MPNKPSTHAVGTRRRFSLAISTMAGLSAVILIGFLSFSAQADTSSRSRIYVVNPDFADVLKHGQPITCDAPPTPTQQEVNQPGGPKSLPDSEAFPPCSITATVKTSRLAARYLKLKSTTLFTGTTTGPFIESEHCTDIDHHPEGCKDEYRLGLPQSLISKLKNVRLYGMHISALEVSVSGRASFPYNDGGQAATTTTAFTTFPGPDSGFGSDPSIQWGPGYVNTCWLPVGAQPQVGLADPHGKKCPGY